MSVYPGKGGQEFIEDSVDRINEIRDLINTYKLDIEISVDGGINNNTCNKCNSDILVSGSYVINSLDFSNSINILRGDISG